MPKRREQKRGGGRKAGEDGIGRMRCGADPEKSSLVGAWSELPGCGDCLAVEDLGLHLSRTLRPGLLLCPRHAGHLQWNPFNKVTVTWGTLGHPQAPVPADPSTGRPERRLQVSKTQ